MNKQWTNLHTHTTFSMLDGHGNVERYAERVHELSMGALAITDHGNLHGWLDFHQECQKYDIKPIFGCEFYQARKSRLDRDPEEMSGPATKEWEQRGPYHLSVMARNQAGYHNIIKLSSRSYLEGYYSKPRIDYELLNDHSEGLIVLSGCLNGEVQQALMRGDYEAALRAAARMQDVVGKENYFIEVMDHGLEDQHNVFEDTVKIAKTIGAKIIPTGDTHYVEKGDAHSHDIMLCLQTKATIDQEKRFRFSGDSFYIHSYDEMVKKFDPEWLQNTLDISESVDVKPPLGELHMPEYPDLPINLSSQEFLAQLTWKGVKERYGDNPSDEVRERVNHELGVIDRMGFPSYFLVVYDVVSWAKNNDIKVGPGRGSAAGSIVSYALGITDLEPLRFGLLFERFLVEGRNEMPDIDLDFDSRYRDDVIQYTMDRYGADHVAYICTFSTEGAKSAIRDAARVIGKTYTEGDLVAKLVPPPVQGKSKTLAQAMEYEPFKTEYDKGGVSKEIIDSAMAIEGIVRQPGIHAGGIVVTPGPITDYIPVMRKTLKDGKPGPISTQWSMDWMEKNGLLKIDYLGIRNLDVIDKCEKLVNERSDGEFSINDVSILDHKYDDDETFELIRTGNTIGMFQLESGGMSEMSSRISPTKIEDIMATVSLFRPGPMESGADDIFINRRNGSRPVTYEHPLLEDILDESLGVMIYQEDVLNVTSKLAGFTVSEADKLRKAIGKKEFDKIKTYREAFVEGCMETNGVDKIVAEKIYSDIEFFAGYGFGKAHAASYAVVAYQTAYLKEHYPVEFMTALLSTVMDDKDKLGKYLNECRRMELDVKAPDFSKSIDDFSIQDDDTILFSLTAIDGVGEATVKSIINGERDYDNLYQFMRGCTPDILNKAVFTHLIKSGALDEILEAKDVPLSKMDRLDVLEQEKKELGTYVTEHPVAEVWPFLEEKITVPISDLETIDSDAKVVLGGVIVNPEERITKRGQKMYTFTFEDVAGSIEVLVFPGVAKSFPFETLKAGSIGLLGGRLSKEGDEENPKYKIFYSYFEPVDEESLYYENPIKLYSKNQLSSEQVNRLTALIKDAEGESPVRLIHKDDHGQTITMQFKKMVDKSIEKELQMIVELANREVIF